MADLSHRGTNRYRRSEELWLQIEAGAHVTPTVKLVRPLGEGGMGTVWVAWHEGLGTEVAVKFLLGDFAANADARARFSQEASASSRVKSAHVVKVYDYGVTDSQVPFLVMELLEGMDLGQRITQGALSPDEVANITSQLCKALTRAHEKDVVHRDIKPGNIFLATEGGDIFVKLLDFGIAKTSGAGSNLRRSTLAGESLGTPFYMSPEQFRSAKTIDSRSDLWSVGVVVYEALTGTLPFVADSLSALAIAVNEGIALPPSQVTPSLPKAIDDWFAKACSHDPKDRFQSARELSDAFRDASGQRADPNSSQRIVIQRYEAPLPSDAGIELRETAFAESAARSPPRRRWPIFVGVAVVATLVGAIFVFEARASKPAQSAAIARQELVVASATQVTPPASTAPLVSAIAADPIPTPDPTTSKRPHHVTETKPPVAPSASATTHGRDIW